MYLNLDKSDLMQLLLLVLVLLDAKNRIVSWEVVLVQENVKAILSEIEALVLTHLDVHVPAHTNVKAIPAEDLAHAQLNAKLTH